MGCTSSAPNMVSSSTADTSFLARDYCYSVNKQKYHLSATVLSYYQWHFFLMIEKSIQFEEEIIDDQSKDTEEIIYRAGNDTNEITVLPSCDTLADPIHVVSLNTGKDNQEVRHLNERIKITDSSDKLKGEEILPKLEQVVEKTIEVYGLEKVDDSQPVLKIAEELQNDDHKDINNIKESNDVRHNEEYVGFKQNKQKEDHPEEAISPSQSESSRATRWEALADIAAELPPSLTVDPITGQIYALAK